MSAAAVIAPPRARVLPSRPDENERFTPRALITELHAEWRFTVDACAVPEAPSAQVIGRYWTKADDGLAQDWSGERLWINPEFDNIRPWVIKAIASSDALAVMLVPANRTEQKWWQELIEPVRDRGPFGIRTRFLPGRIAFGTPAEPEGPKKSRTPFGCVLLIFPAVRR